jgi:hypothetical protein
LADNGARHLVLLGRTVLPPRDCWSAIPVEDPLYRRISAVRDLEERGAAVQLAAVDISNEREIADFFNAYSEQGGAQLRGVIHAAGVLQHRSIVEMDATELQEVMRAKVLGSWQLHRLLARVPLDFFVLFSSASSLLSSPRLGGYAAANAFLDALAHYRRVHGLPALSINWGVWSESGMATRFDRDDVAAAAMRGMGTITTAQGLESLGRLLGHDASQVAVLPVDWQRWRELYPAFAGAPLLEHVMRSDATPARARRSALLTPAALRAASPDERCVMLERYLIDVAAAVIGMDPVGFDRERPLGEFGIDSLMTVELKNRIELDAGVIVPMVKLLEGPSMSQLAATIESLLNTATPDPHTLATPATHDGQLQAAAVLADIDGLSDDQVDALLTQLLANSE